MSIKNIQLVVTYEYDVDTESAAYKTLNTDQLLKEDALEAFESGLLNGQEANVTFFIDGKEIEEEFKDEDEDEDEDDE